MSTTPKITDNAMEKVTSSGTGDFSLGGALTGYVSFSSSLSDGDSFYYGAKDLTNGGTEVGIGTYHSGTNTISRDKILRSSSGGSAVNFSATTTFVYVTVPAETLLPRHSICEGRLTLTSGEPITTGDVIGFGTLYFTPFLGSLIGLWNGNGWQIYAFSELSLSLSSLTANTLYDIFVYDNAGTLTLEAVAWSNSSPGSSARATALALQDGIYVKSGTPTRRYLGTVYVYNGGEDGIVSDDSLVNRYLWNYYNRAYKRGEWSDGTSHTYGTNAWRLWDNQSAPQVNFVIGVVEEWIPVRIQLEVTNASGTLVVGGLGWNTTSSNTEATDWVQSTTDSLFTGSSPGELPALGKNYAAFLENMIRGASASTLTFGRIDLGLRC